MTKISSVYQNVSVQSETECLNMQDKTGVWLKVGCELQTKSKLKGNKRNTSSRDSINSLQMEKSSPLVKITVAFRKYF